MKKDKDRIISSIVGAGNTFRGEFHLVGLIRIDGTLEGKIHTDSVMLISESGRGEGTIHAKSVDIGGTFNGDLFVSEKIVLRSTARVTGNITAGFMLMEEGARYNGKCKIATSTLDLSPEKSEPLIDELNSSKSNGKAKKKDKNLARL